MLVNGIDITKATTEQLRELAAGLADSLLQHYDRLEEIESVTIGYSDMVDYATFNRAINRDRDKFLLVQTEIQYRQLEFIKDIAIGRKSELCFGCGAILGKEQHLNTCALID